jgi:hypothetical protein
VCGNPILLFVSVGTTIKPDMTNEMWRKRGKEDAILLLDNYKIAKGGG